MTCRLLLVPGSLRAASTNAAVLRTAAHLAPAGVDAELYDGLAALPHFNPDDDAPPLPPAAAALRAAIHAADGILFCTPEYAGALPGSFKNLLDWTIGDDEAGSIHDKPVAWINASPRAAPAAHEELRVVLGYANARVVDRACATVPVTSGSVGPDGLVHDEQVQARVVAALTELAAAACAAAASG